MDVVGFADEAARDQWQDPVKAAFRLLADTGFGGERSRGWGRSETPEFIEGELPGDDHRRGGAANRRRAEAQVGRGAVRSKPLPDRASRSPRREAAEPRAGAGAGPDRGPELWTDEPSPGRATPRGATEMASVSRPRDRRCEPVRRSRRQDGAAGESLRLESEPGSSGA